MRILWLLVLILLALEGAGAQRFQPAPGEQKPAATPESTSPQLFAALDQDEVDLAVVRKLLEQNPALVNARSEDGDTPLHLAAGNGQEEVIKLLLSMHAAVNARNEKNLGRTPLHDAVSVKRTRSIELLLAAKADVNAADGSSRRTRRKAMNLKHWLFLALFAALIASPTVNAQKQRGRTSRRTAITGAAAESWKTFLPAFTAAVKNRDRAYLRKVMVKDFTYTFGDSADDQDEAFRFFDDRNNYDGKTGWQVLQEILAKGAVPDVENMRTGSKRPTYIAPPRAGTGCRSSWEFYGGSWHWMYFVCGD